MSEEHQNGPGHPDHRACTGGPDAAGPGDDRARTVLVVGGTGGIGSAVARRFAARGATVWAAGLGADKAALPSAAEVAALPGEIRRRELDLSQEDALEGLLREVESLDVLVNAAGVIARDAEFESEVFAHVVGVNLTATARACFAARRPLGTAGGSIVNIASMLSYFGGPRVPGYSASKGGVVQLTKSLAVAWAREGIRVNAVAPGWIRTPLTSDLHDGGEADRRIVERTPMGRWGEPSDVVGAVDFLAGPDARFVTGAVLPVDGGYLAA